MGEDIPRIGNLTASPDFLGEILPEPKGDISPSSLSGIQSGPQGVSSSFGIDPSLRIIPSASRDSLSPAPEPDITIGNPQKAGPCSLHIPITIALPGMKQPVSFTMSLDLKPSTDKEKQ
jgi:hypothetical protein